MAGSGHRPRARDRRRRSHPAQRSRAHRRVGQRQKTMVAPWREHPHPQVRIIKAFNKPSAAAGEQLGGMSAVGGTVWMFAGRPEGRRPAQPPFETGPGAAGSQPGNRLPGCRRHGQPTMFTVSSGRWWHYNGPYLRVSRPGNRRGIHQEPPGPRHPSPGAGPVLKPPPRLGTGPSSLQARHHKRLFGVTVAVRLP